MQPDSYQAKPPINQIAPETPKNGTFLMCYGAEKGWLMHLAFFHWLGVMRFRAGTELDQGLLLTEFWQYLNGDLT